MGIQTFDGIGINDVDATTNAEYATVRTNQFFEMDEFDESGFVRIENGGDGVNQAYTRTRYISVIPGSVIKYRLYATSAVAIVAFYDGDKTYMPTAAIAGNGILREWYVTVPSGAEYVRFSTNNLESSEIRIGYETLTMEVDSIKSNLLKRTNQLFDKSNYVDQAWMNNSGVITYNNTTYFITHPIPVEVGETYHFASSRFVTLFNGETVVPSSLQNINNVTIPDGVTHMVITGLRTTFETFMVNKGSTLLPYEPYWAQNINDSTIQDITDRVTQSLDTDISELLPRNAAKQESTVYKYYLDGDTVYLKFVVNFIAGKVNIYRNADMASAGSRTDFVDIENGKIGFYRPVGNPTTDTLEVLTEKQIGFSFVAGHEYMAESIREHGNIATIRITDAYTGDTDELTVSNNDSTGLAWGYRGYQAVNADITVKDFKQLSTQPYNAKVLVLGDSYIEGASIGGFKNDRWCALLRDALDGDCFINGWSGRPASQGYDWLNGYLKDIVRPQYVILHFGINDGNLANYIQQTDNSIALIKNYYKATPILVKIPPTVGTNSANANIWQDINEYVENSGELYLDERIVLTNNYDGVTQNLSLYLNDKTHPNVAGHHAIFERLKFDVPELFVNV